MIFDLGYILFILPALGLSFIASLLVKYYSSKYLNIVTSKNISGLDTVKLIAQNENLNISLSTINNHLGDNYNPTNRVLTLSNEIANTPTIGSVAIAAHESGHALQHKQGSLLFKARGLIVPVVNIGTNIGYFIIMIALLISSINLGWIGVIFFSASTFFSLLTLPIEIDASKKALNFIRTQDLLDTTEIGGAKKVLIAASLTYFAGLISSFSTLLYFILKIDGLNSRRN